MIDRWDQEDDNRRIRSRNHTIGEYFATQQPLLAPLSEAPARGPGDVVDPLLRAPVTALSVLPSGLRSPCHVR